MSLTNAKVDDVLLLACGRYDRRLDTVLKVTKTQVHGRLSKWRKNGREIGIRSGYIARLATQEEIIQIQSENRRKSMIYHIQEGTSPSKLKSYPTEKLQHIIDVLHEQTIL